jgi:hypothetical protein
MKKSMIIIIMSGIALIVLSILAHSTNDPLFAWLWMIPGATLVLGLISQGSKSK